jgi:hypothetical protein
MGTLNLINWALSVLSKASVVLVIGFAVLSSRANSDELLQVSDLPADRTINGRKIANLQ